MSCSPFAPGNKQSMQRTLLPKARAAGARLVPDCTALRLVHDRARVTGVLVQHANGAARQRALIRADVVFVCSISMKWPPSRLSVNGPRDVRS